MRTPKATTS